MRRCSSFVVRDRLISLCIIIISFCFLSVFRFVVVFWLLTLQNTDRNSWGKICSGITNLNSTGEFIIPAETIALSEKNRDEIQLIMRMLGSEGDDSDHSINSNESD